MEIKTSFNYYARFSFLWSLCIFKKQSSKTTKKVLVACLTYLLKSSSNSPACILIYKIQNKVSDSQAFISSKTIKHERRTVRGKVNITIRKLCSIYAISDQLNITLIS